MKCPVCSEEMIVLELDQVEIDYCTSCAGIWLDEGELELLLEGAVEKDTLLKSIKPAGRVKEKKKRCPRCRRRMRKIHGGTETTVLLDACPARHGLWFDRGELLQVLEMGGERHESPVADLLKDLFPKTAKDA